LLFRSQDILYCVVSWRAELGVGKDEAGESVKDEGAVGEEFREGSGSMVGRIEKRS
jgi:hypothetical protein